MCIDSLVSLRSMKVLASKTLYHLNTVKRELNGKADMKTLLKFIEMHIHVGTKRRVYLAYRLRKTENNWGNKNALKWRYDNKYTICLEMNQSNG